MSLYVDTSALIKKYIREAGSDEVIELLDAHSIIGTVTITQVAMASP